MPRKWSQRNHSPNWSAKVEGLIPESVVCISHLQSSNYDFFTICKFCAYWVLIIAKWQYCALWLNDSGIFPSEVATEANIKKQTNYLILCPNWTKIRRKVERCPFFMFLPDGRSGKEKCLTTLYFECSKSFLFFNQAVISNKTTQMYDFFQTIQEGWNKWKLGGKENQPRKNLNVIVSVACCPHGCVCECVYVHACVCERVCSFDCVCSREINRMAL